MADEKNVKIQDFFILEFNLVTNFIFKNENFRQIYR